MKWIVGLFVLILILFLFGYDSFFMTRKEEPFCISYHVTINDSYPHKVLISYQDKDQIQTFYSIDKHWEKTVCLPPDKIASLFVEDIFDPEEGFFYLNPDTSSDCRLMTEQPITISIIHKKKIVIHSGSGLQRISLTRNESKF